MESSLCESLRNSDFQLEVSAEVETEICSFYEEIIKELYKLSGQKFLEIRKSLANIRSYKNPDVEEHERLSFDEECDRLAYIFAYSVIHSVVMYDRFSAMLKTNLSMLKKIISMKKIRLCILGGGPGFEAIAVCKLLGNIFLNYDDSGRSPFQVYITIIDMFSGWEKDAKLIISSAQQKLFSSNIVINFNFIQADLTTDFTDDVKKAIQKAHITIAFKFFSDVNEASYSNSEMSAMVLRIIDFMSYNKACLFFLDTSGGGVFKKIDNMIDKLSHTSRIYGPCLHNCHMLSLDTVQKFSVALKHIFHFLNCTSRTTISCSAWIKFQHFIKVDELYLNSVSSFVHDPVEESKKLRSKAKAPRVKKKQNLVKQNVLLL